MKAEFEQKINKALKQGKIYTRYRSLSSGAKATKGSVILKNDVYYALRGVCNNLLGIDVVTFDDDSINHYNNKFENKVTPFKTFHEAFCFLS